jgi:hypothetical protein
VRVASTARWSRRSAKVTEALEYLERACGRLYDFHQLVGHADLVFEEAARALARGGHEGWATELSEEIVGRNVIDGRSTFQVVEEFDDGYYAAVRTFEHDLRAALVGGHRHLLEARLKAARRSPGRPGHEAEPGEVRSGDTGGDAEGSA